MEMQCPIKGCGDTFAREDMVLNSHLRNKHNCSHQQRLRLRLKHCPQDSGFKTQSVSDEERELSKMAGI